MKKVLISICVSLSAFAFIYMLGAFYCISFDIRTWDEVSRSMVAVMGGALAFTFGCANYFTTSEEETISKFEKKLKK